MSNFYLHSKLDNPTLGHSLIRVLSSWTPFGAYLAVVSFQLYIYLNTSTGLQKMY